jgi:RNA polymerase sigma factor (sigma-70 family)
LYSYALWGLTLAAGAYRSETGVPFEQFVRGKGMYVAIDAMREDRVLSRHKAHGTPMFFSYSDSGDGEACLLDKIADRRSSDSFQAVDLRDQVRSILARLADEDRQTLLMYYADGMTFKEIARVFNKSESAISIRHRNLLVKLRRMASSKLAQA